MWIGWALGIALAGPFDGLGILSEERNSQPTAVQDAAVQGTVRLVCAGREGDQVKVDGWPFGVLPLETEIAGGLHTFRVEGEAGVLEINTNVSFVEGEVTEIDLAVAVAAPAPDKPTSIQGDKSDLFDENGAIISTQTPEAKPDPEVSTDPVPADPAPETP